MTKFKKTKEEKEQEVKTNNPDNYEEEYANYFSK